MSEEKEEKKAPAGEEEGEWVEEGGAEEWVDEAEEWVEDQPTGQEAAGSPARKRITDSPYVTWIAGFIGLLLGLYFTRSCGG